MIPLFRVLCVGVALIAVSSCSELPRGAAIDYEILAGAETAESDVAIYPVTRAFLPSLNQWPVVGEQRLSWIGTSRGSSSTIISPGDTLDLRIWDSGDNSLLTAPEQRSVDMAQIKVSSTGSIFVPYIGDVVVSGKTTTTARQEIQDNLETIVPSAQVQLSVSSGRNNSVDLVGGVVSPGSYPMPDRNFTILNLIAESGGVNTTLSNPQVRLVRSGQIFGTSVSNLFANPNLDTRLIGGDKVIVEEDRRYFVTIGSTGQESLFPFTKDDISALEAMSITGGVNDARGDPQGILILREYPASVVTPGSNGPRQQRVIFTVDLTNSDGLFSAQNFPIRSGDVVLATESPVNNVRTILTLLGLAVGSVNAVTN